MGERVSEQTAPRVSGKERRREFVGGATKKKETEGRKEARERKGGGEGRRGRGDLRKSGG